MNIEQNSAIITLSITQMSGQEEHSHRPQQEQLQVHISESHQDDNVERFVDLMMLASAPPPRSSNLLDYLYFHGVPISVSPFQRADAVAVGGGANNWNDIEAVAASIMSRSLYDRHPVKKVITEEARLEIVDKKFTVDMVEELKINDVCGIWQEQFEEDEDIKILPCNHAFKAGAIMKWLEEEKAECPVCRFSLKSKEVNENQNFDDGEEDEDEDEGEGEDEIHNNEPEPAVEASEPAQDNDVVRVNNIASRLIQSVAGRVSGRINHPYVSVPMNQFLQSVRMMSSSSRPREPMRAAVPSAGGAAPAPNSQAAYANAGREVRAEALANDNNNNNNNNNNNYNNNNNNYYNIINNYYYDNNNNNNDNNNSDDEDVVLNQEQADIEEAIRRSLQ